MVDISTLSIVVVDEDFMHKETGIHVEQVHLL